MPFFRVLYDSEQEMRDAFANLKSNKIKLWECRICHCMIAHHTKTKHFKSQEHLARLRGNSDCPKLKNCKLWTCDACDIEMRCKSKNNHLKTTRHIRNTTKDPVCLNEDELKNEENCN